MRLLHIVGRAVGSCNFRGCGFESLETGFGRITGADDGGFGERLRNTGDELDRGCCWLCGVLAIGPVRRVLGLSDAVDHFLELGETELGDLLARGAFLAI